jgi:hypothetical protein
MADASYTVVENHILLSPGRADERDITKLEEECVWCVKSYPECGSDTPRAFCPIIVLPSDFIFVTTTDKGVAID